MFKEAQPATGTPSPRIISQWPDRILSYTVPTNGTIPIVPITTDPAKLAIYPATRLNRRTAFSPQCPPDRSYPTQLIDPNAVLELNAGTFPKPNFGTSQYISSIPQPTNVREDVVRIDHAINSKLQLMGHYLHDAVDQTYYPPLWGIATFPTVGTAMKNPSWSSTVKLTQTLSPNLLNETAFLFSGNTIHLDPVGVSHSHQDGPLQASSRLPITWLAACRRSSSGRPIQYNLEFQLLPVEELL